MECYVILRTDSDVQPLPLIVNPTHGFLERDVIRRDVVGRLSIALSNLVANTSPRAAIVYKYLIYEIYRKEIAKVILIECYAPIVRSTVHNRRGVRSHVHDL